MEGLPVTRFAIGHYAPGKTRPGLQPPLNIVLGGMQSANQAEEAVQRFLESSRSIGTDPYAPILVVDPKLTRETSWGWVVFYNSKEFVEDGNIKHRLAGNGPFLVNRETNEMFATGSDQPLEAYISDYEEILRDGLYDD